MTLHAYLGSYYRVGKLTKDNMQVRKAEFLTEVVLSLFILIMTVQKGANVEVSVGAIALIHSFNVARAVEAYKEAKIGQQQIQDYE